jgi:hypothetical protein
MVLNKGMIRRHVPFILLVRNLKRHLQMQNSEAKFDNSYSYLKRATAFFVENSYACWNKGKSGLTSVSDFTL